jgi:hypothetical protein
VEPWVGVSKTTPFMEILSIAWVINNKYL